MLTDSSSPFSLESRVSSLGAKATGVIRTGELALALAIGVRGVEEFISFTGLIEVAVFSGELLGLSIAGDSASDAVTLLDGELVGPDVVRTCSSGGFEYLCGEF